MADVTDAQAEKLIKLYTKAEKEILAEVTKALLKGNSTYQLKAMLKNVRKIRKDLLGGARDWSTQAIQEAYEAGQKSTGLGGGVGFNAVHQQAVAVLAENAYGRFEIVDQVIGRRVNDVYRSIALENVTGQVVGYQTWQQTAKRIRSDMAERGITGFVDAAGKRWNMETYAEMIARTTPRQAMIEGTKNRLLEHDHDLAEIIGGIGKNTCDICRAWDGRVVSLTGKTSGYPTLDEARDAGVFHPMCTHNIATAMSFEDKK
ncbi:MAG: hypothetical protein PHD55_06265 [Methanoregula sp.]|nr:hypothetical protein [Methanoregula sp.]